MKSLEEQIYKFEQKYSHVDIGQTIVLANLYSTLVAFCLWYVCVCMCVYWYAMYT